MANIVSRTVVFILTLGDEKLDVCVSEAGSVNQDLTTEHPVPVDTDNPASAQDAQGPPRERHVYVPFKVKPRPMTWFYVNGAALELIGVGPSSIN